MIKLRRATAEGKIVEKHLRCWWQKEGLENVLKNRDLDVPKSQISDDVHSWEERLMRWKLSALHLQTGFKSSTLPPCICRNLERLALRWCWSAFPEQNLKASSWIRGSLWLKSPTISTFINTFAPVHTSWTEFKRSPCVCNGFGYDEEMLLTGLCE